MDDVILLPRIRKIFENGLQQNVILYGTFGSGKTTLARILIGRYTKDKPFLELNSSFYTSIDVLRSKIDDFCSKVYMGFDLQSNISQDSIKYVFLDEFERTSTQYQDALKAYIEEFSGKNVRFILTTNHINKVSDGILSRLLKVNFDCQSPEEEKYLKIEMYKRIINTICPKEGFTISKEDLSAIINKKFPDFRAVMVELEHYLQTGSITQSESTVNLKLRNDLFNLVFDKEKKYDDTYHFLMNNFGPEKIYEVVEIMGRSFAEYVMESRPNQIDKLFEVSWIVVDHSKILESSTDPIVLGMSLIGKIKSLF